MLNVVKMATFRRLSKSENFKFIEFVQNYPAVYDAWSSDYMNRTLTSNIFENIAKRMKIEGMTGNMFIYILFKIIINITRMNKFESTVM